MKSVVSYPERGNGGKNSYRGNCSPKLIEDIISQYKIKYMSDYMVGSGTTEDVCKSKSVDGMFLDLNRGFDLMSMDIPDRPENIFNHPPYWDIVKYAGYQYDEKKVIEKYNIMPRHSDLSQINNWEDFMKNLNYTVLKQFASLQKGGHMFVLMGDIKKQGKLYSMISEIVKPGTLEQIIIKMQHNCWSDSQTYSNYNFVPIVHEYLMVLRKDNALIYPVQTIKKLLCDVTKLKNITWKDLLASYLEEHGPSRLEEIYIFVSKCEKSKNNPHYKEKCRQVLRTHFFRESRSVYRLAA